MNKKLMVTGYGGFVAGSVVWQALRGGEWDVDTWDVYALSLLELPKEGANFHCLQFDMSDSARLRQVFADIRPDAVVHTAALADIDYCQSHQDEAERVNVGITRELAGLCAGSGAKLIICSTDTVFDGTKGMYTEEDAPHAVNFYADTKIRAEGIVRDTVGNGVITRLSLVMGLPVLGAGNSFLAKTFDAWKRGDQVKFPANEIRTPVDVITLGRAFLELAGNDFTGTLHLAGSTRINRYEMACDIAGRLGYSRDSVAATDSNAMPGRAPRPNDASLDNAKAKRVLSTPMQTLMSGLDLVLQMKEEQAKEACG
jgi:dTDP-4-dehydrorhamnose reductase